MGLIKSWMKEMGDTWDGMARGDANAFLGTGAGGTGTGSGSGTGTGHATTPEGAVINPAQRQKLMRFFHKTYKRYPVSEFEFQQWLRDNW